MGRCLQTQLQCSGIQGTVTLSSAARSLVDRRWHAITSSHLGHSTRLHAEVCRYISRSMIDARRSGHCVVVASESAAEPWVVRAAELFGVPLIHVHATGNDTEQAVSNDQVTGRDRAIVRCQTSATRDDVVAAIADQVDCVYLRPHGNIEASLQQQLEHTDQATVRIAIHSPAIDKRSHKATLAMMGRGAVGWYCRPPDRQLPDRQPIAHSGDENSGVRVTAKTDAARIVADDWTKTDGQWLVHCTRAPSGPWPGQSMRQHRDSLLLGGSSTMAMSTPAPLDSLLRIVQTRRLVASALTSDRRWPVVCFSQQPLAWLLSQRRYRPHLHRWDYEPYGIAIRKTAAVAAGFAPVVYGSAGDASTLPADERYRHQATGKTYDWTREREWRHLGDVDLDRFDVADVRVFVGEESDAPRVAGRFVVSVVGRWIDSELDGLAFDFQDRQSAPHVDL
ncbi:hypothetical protein NHH03_03575 [Stieleria sp. TO1_6]|uniref:hypothetical protein n=1 Tax=Stieleria tagensis TaxID=2956795 RepID=UPI00209AF9AD|nr:hypothetical protein [Stieleria tagensis]MCO8120805.1 hypothetical protein [Stieleria tagensis]